MLDFDYARRGGTIDRRMGGYHLVFLVQRIFLDLISICALKDALGLGTYGEPTSGRLRRERRARDQRCRWLVISRVRQAANDPGADRVLLLQKPCVRVMTKALCNKAIISFADMPRLIQSQIFPKALHLYIILAVSSG